MHSYKPMIEGRVRDIDREFPYSNTGVAGGPVKLFLRLENVGPQLELDGTQTHRLAMTLLAGDQASSTSASNADTKGQAADHGEGRAFDDFVSALGTFMQRASQSVPPLFDSHPNGQSEGATSAEQLARSVDAVASEKLSRREIEVLQLLINGDSNKQIARRLHIAEPTVKCHVKSILRKLRARNRFEAAMWAMKLQFRKTG